MRRRPVFLISTEGMTPEQMKAAAHAALERYAEAVEAVEGDTPDEA